MKNSNKYKYVVEELNTFNPSELTYREFVLVGTVLNDFGMPFELFEAWADQDTPSPYADSCKSVWDELNNPLRDGADGLTFDDVRDEIAIRDLYHDPSDNDLFIDDGFFSYDDERYGQVPYDYESMYYDDKEI